MKGSFIYRNSMVPSPDEVQAEKFDEDVRAEAEHMVMEWEAEQGPNHQPLEDKEREEMVQEYMEELQSRRNEIADTLNKAA